MNLSTERCEQFIEHFRLTHLKEGDKEQIILALKYAFKLGYLKDVMPTKYRERK